ncbi:MAG: VanZ family protein [Parcubacteria group bacterium GW2011_GWA1_42_7]|nr:MAG: VanZ family protein [Parcubacteria group bacterium GW2011_GWB1_42_6]KKS69162.1 MAG: VanZ family protein [Parcubacteria group bacterium GW2011_GWA1_42_7]KKS91951.1 MAG: VanZ family protein [Parcubacteria group bacterium GW2011_GWC1_43_12]
MSKFLKYILPVSVWAGIIYSLSATPNLNSGLAAFWDVFWRKLAHAGEFSILTFLLFRAFRGYDYKFRSALAISVFLSLGYAFLDEFHQLFVPMRMGKLFDVFIDILGIVFAAFVIIWIKFRKNRVGIDR